jgi:hypothetical protein
LAKLKNLYLILQNIAKIEEDLTAEEFAEILLNLKRVNPAVALWFMLHYPTDESKLYAWEHIRWADENPKITNPDRYLESLIKDKDKDLEWLLDQRTKDLIRGELEEIAKPLIEERKRKEKLEILKKEISLLYRMVHNVYSEKLKKLFKTGDVDKYISSVLKSEDLKALEEVHKKLSRFFDKDADDLL